MGEKLRFAPLIRVSTESQEQQGESLNVQKSQIIDAVRNLGGEVPKHCWKYSGQEHASPEFERKMFNQLLEDSGKGLFDAVIVFDTSRWSRDNLNSKKGLEILKRNGIKFFTLNTEYDLYSPQATLFIGMSTEMNEFFALEQSRKSILSRIAKAKRGVPASGALPYGRTFDKKKEQWDIIVEKQEQIKWACESYLSGTTMLVVAEALGVHVTTLWDIMKNKCGDTWECKFQNKRVGIEETVQIKIPRLLPQATIDAIHQRCEANKTYTHGQIKNRYLLGRVVFCSHCGRALSGVKHNKCQLTYYSHSWRRNYNCPGPKSVRADYLDKAVFIQLLNLSTDLATVQKAHTDTMPSPQQRVKIEKSLSMLKSKLTNTQKKKRKIIDLIADDFLSTDDAKQNLGELKTQEQALKKAIIETKTALDKIPNPETIKLKSKFVQNVLKALTKNMRATEGNYKKTSWEDKRELVQTIFSGHTANGKRAGVYIKKCDDGLIEYELLGDLLNDAVCGIIPMPSDQYKELLNIFEPEFDLSKEDVIVEKQDGAGVEQDLDGDRRCDPCLPEGQWKF